MKYLVWLCPKCKTWQVRCQRNYDRVSTRRLIQEQLNQMSCKCKFCGKSKSFRNRRSGGSNVVHRWRSDKDYARAECQALNRKFNKGFTDFDNTNK